MNGGGKGTGGKFGGGADKSPGGKGEGGKGEKGKEDKATRIKNNTKNIFHYSDKSFSIGRQLFKWVLICEHFGWDPDKVCGPVRVSTNTSKDDHYNCMDPSHE